MLLYTLVYGAMPFDGSDFEKLKRQITTGDYYEPNASAASGLIRSMLTVNPAKRANITDVAAHWWTNKNADTSLSDELSRTTPGRRTSDYFEDENVFSDSQEKTVEPARIVTPVFDSTRKPKKSILKKRNISSGDSGCALNKEAELSVSSVESTSGDDTSSLQRPLHDLHKLSPMTSRAAGTRKDSLSSSSSTELLDFSYDSSESPLDSFPEAILELL